MSARRPATPGEIAMVGVKPSGDEAARGVAQPARANIPMMTAAAFILTCV